MPIERHAISRSQFCDLLALDPACLIGIEGVGRTSTTFTLVVESNDEHNGHVSATHDREENQHAAHATERTLAMSKKMMGGRKTGSKGKGGKGCNY